jgi:hypothetical protein
MSAASDNIHNLHTPNIDAMREHLEHMFGGYLDGYHDGKIELAWTDCHPNKDGRYPLRHGRMYGTDEIEELVTEAARLNSMPFTNVYVGAALRRPDTFPGGRASAPDVLALTCGYVDLDDPGATARAKDRYGQAKPTKVVVTGTEPHTRAQLWWRLDEPITDQQLSEALLKGMASALGGDSTVTDPPRVMRLAGSIAWPVKPNRKVELTSISPLKQPGQSVYTVDHLARLFPPVYEGGNVDGVKFQADDGVTRGANAFGMEDRVEDGRERYMLKTANAVLIQLIGETGKAPTAQELFDASWEQYQRSTDFTRPGRGRKEYAAKCVYTVKRFYEGRIRGCETIEKVQALYRQRQQARGSGPKASEPPPEQPQAPPTAIRVGTAFPIDPAKVPPRDWIVPGLMLRKNVSFLVAPPGSGKSLLTLHWSLMCSTAIPWGGWTPRKGEKVLVINTEDDFDEMQRRLYVAATEMGIEQDAVIDRIVLAEQPENIVIARFDTRSKSIVRTPLVEDLVKTINDLGIGVVIVDPFAETFEGEENNNSEVKWAGVLWREVARRTRSCVVLVHHTKKYAGDMAGDADASRGGGALIGTARILVTLFVMTEDEAQAVGVSPEDRLNYVRFDDAKANHNKKGLVRWFEKKSRTFPNSTGFIPSDDVGVLVPWKPPGLMDDVSMHALTMVWDTIDRGVPDPDGKPPGQFYTASATSKDKHRWVGNVLITMLHCSEEKAKAILKEWLANGVLESFDYLDPVQRKSRTGVRCNAANRPDKSTKIFT